MPTISEDVDLNIYPVIDQKYKATQGAQLTIGDLHANALKLIYFLVRHGVMALTEDQYKRLVEIYNKRKRDFTPVDLHDFNRIISDAKVNPGATIRLIGDELADRGSNDYFVLKLLERLGKAKLGLEILLSNHSVEFLGVYENQSTYLNTALSRNGQTRSLEALGKLFKFMPKLALEQEVNSIIEQYYLPHLKLISYTFDNVPPRITLYTHATVGLETVKGLALQLGINYDDSSIASLAATIDKINRAFYEQVVKANKIYQTVFPNGKPSKEKNSSMYERVMWNRDYFKAQTPLQHHAYQLYFVHGHDTPRKECQHPLDNIINLDNSLGKRPGSHRGTYTIHYSHEVPSSLNKTLPCDATISDGLELLIEMPTQAIAPQQAFTQGKPKAPALAISSQANPRATAHSYPASRPDYLSNSSRAKANFQVAGKEWCAAQKQHNVQFAFDYLEQTNKIVYVDKDTQRNTELLSLSEKRIVFVHNRPLDFSKALTAGMALLAVIKVRNIKIEGGTQQEREMMLQQIYNSSAHHQFHISIPDQDKPLRSQQDIAQYLQLTSPAAISCSPKQ